MTRDSLTQRQLEVVEAVANVVLTLGAAGTGKTTTALWAAREHLVEDETDRALFVTFSRAAVTQIAERARGVFAQVGNRIEVHTFHSLAYRVLTAFGRYGGHGTTPPQIESAARARLLGRDEALVSYDQLIPAALRLLGNSLIADLVCQRWGLVICDEFQDTGDDQWELLNKVCANGRLLLLADPNQMIHEWRRDGVGPGRLDEGYRMAESTIELEPASHRDPSQVIPAMAFEILHRRFDSDAVRAAVEAGRLEIVQCEAHNTTSHVVDRIRTLREGGCRTIGVFETTNNLAAQLGVQFSEAGMNYALLGLPEAQGEALAAQSLLFGCGLGQVPFDDARVQLAIFLTACSRGQFAPPLAVQIKDDRIEHPDLQDRFHQLEVALGEANEPEQLLDLIGESWSRLGITAGHSSWDRANRSFRALAHRIIGRVRSDAEALATELMGATAQLRSVVLQTGDVREGSRLHVMNRHQTKGREWDGVILVFREGQWLTSESRPYAETHRLLYVTLTRARSKVVVMLPSTPHEVVAPFAAMAG